MNKVSEWFDDEYSVKLGTSTSQVPRLLIHGAGDKLPREWPWFCGATGRGTLGVLVFPVGLSVCHE